MSRTVVTGRTIYEDERLHATTTAVTVRGYWLPFGSSRTIPIRELAGVSTLVRDPATDPGWPRWGRRGPAWFPLDWSRSRRTIAVALWGMDGRCTVLTPWNPGRLVALLSGLGVPEHRRA